MVYVPQFEEGFERVGPGRYASPEEAPPPADEVLQAIEKIVRKKSDRRRSHRAQPTRRACNAR